MERRSNRVGSGLSDDFQYDVYLSYISDDLDAAQALAQRLRVDGVRVGFDRWCIAPGESIPLAIELGLEGSRTLVLLMSKGCLAAEWAMQERATAIFRDPANKLPESPSIAHLPAFRSGSSEPSTADDGLAITHASSLELGKEVPWYGGPAPLVFRQGGDRFRRQQHGPNPQRLP
jgi:hypothetical protein